jgi:hypothetical protein
LVHDGNEEGFVPNVKFMFLCKKSNTADAHCEMDGDCCENYFVVQLFANLLPESVIVVDSSGNKNRKKEMFLGKL